MKANIRSHEQNKLIDQVTGGNIDEGHFKIIVFPIDKYEIKIKLGPSDEFIEVVEVQINKEFLSHKQKISKKGYHDVDKFYPE